MSASSSKASTAADVVVPGDLFAGESEIRSAFRQRDWTATPLGPVASWSPSLRTSVQHILSSAFPNLVLWGPEFVQLYNDWYLELMGDRHPAALGASLREGALGAWPFEPVIYDRVTAGETTSRERVPLTVTRMGRERKLELTLSYSPIFDERAAVGGIMVTVFESAAHEDVAPSVRARRAGDRPEREAPPTPHR